MTFDAKFFQSRTEELRDGKIASWNPSRVTNSQRPQVAKIEMPRFVLTASMAIDFKLLNMIDEFLPISTMNSRGIHQVFEA